MRRRAFLATTAAASLVPPSLVSLADRFRGRQQARGLAEGGEGDLSGSYLVQWDGETYWTTLVVRSEAFTRTPG